MTSNCPPHQVRARLQRLLTTMQSAAGAGGVTPLGVPPPSGALLYGPSGNGKSLLASCLAAACGWPTFCVKGSQLFGAYVGETEAAIRELFRKARENAPSIVLLDELDAIGGSRGDLGEASEQGGGGTAMERALSTLLNEMDGVGIAGPKFGCVGDDAGAVSGIPAVFLLGLTNRPELIDAALLRPGRLEQLLHVPHPNLEEREAILGVHTRHLTLGDEVNLASIAERTERFSGAALAALCRETTMQALARQWPRRGGGDRWERRTTATTTMTMTMVRRRRRRRRKRASRFPEVPQRRSLTRTAWMSRSWSVRWISKGLDASCSARWYSLTKSMPNWRRGTRSSERRGPCDDRQKTMRFEDHVKLAGVPLVLTGAPQIWKAHPKFGPNRCAAARTPSETREAKHAMRRHARLARFHVCGRRIGKPPTLPPVHGGGLD